MSSPDTIRPVKLGQEVQNRLLALIRDGGLCPGDALPSERELMARYGVGRPAIREAMQGLEHMGLVTIRHGERPRVAQPSMAGLIERMGTTMRHMLTHDAAALTHMKEARVLLDCDMARIAATRRTGADLADLTALLDRQSAATDPEDFTTLDGAFHRRIAAISGNPIFAVLCAEVFDWMRIFHVDYVRKPGLEALTLAEHRAILAAIAASDPDAAAAAMHGHLTRANALYHQGNAT